MYAEISNYFDRFSYMEKVCSQASSCENFFPLQLRTCNQSRGSFPCFLTRRATQPGAIWLKALTKILCLGQFFLLCLKAISHLFSISEVVWNVKEQFALKTINLLPTDRKGGRILEVCGGLLSKPTHIRTLKHLLYSVF